MEANHGEYLPRSASRENQRAIETDALDAETLLDTGELLTRLAELDLSPVLPQALAPLLAVFARD